YPSAALSIRGALLGFRLHGNCSFRHANLFLRIPVGRAFHVTSTESQTLDGGKAASNGEGTSDRPGRQANSQPRSQPPRACFVDRITRACRVWKASCSVNGSMMSCVPGSNGRLTSRLMPLAEMSWTFPHHQKSSVRAVF